MAGFSGLEALVDASAREDPNSSGEDTVQLLYKGREPMRLPFLFLLHAALWGGVEPGRGQQEFGRYHDSGRVHPLSISPGVSKEQI